jgi:hypothetical protein
MHIPVEERSGHDQLVIEEFYVDAVGHCGYPQLGSYGRSQLHSHQAVTDEEQAWLGLPNNFSNNLGLNVNARLSQTRIINDQDGIHALSLEGGS